VSGVKHIWAGSSANSRFSGSDNVKLHLNIIHTRYSPSLLFFTLSASVISQTSSCAIYTATAVSQMVFSCTCLMADTFLLLLQHLLELNSFTQ